MTRHESPFVALVIYGPEGDVLSTSYPTMGDPQESDGPFNFNGIAGCTSRLFPLYWDDEPITEQVLADALVSVVCRCKGYGAGPHQHTRGYPECATARQAARQVLATFQRPDTEAEGPSRVSSDTPQANLSL